MKPFVLNRHGRLVFPSNFMGELDFTVIDTLDQLAAVVRRDFEAKAPTGTEIETRANEGRYQNRYQLLRDLALTLFWGNRYAITMYEKRPIRWRDVPRARDDVFLPVLEPWNRGAEKVKAIQDAWASLPPKWDAEAEARIAEILLPPFVNKLHVSTGLPAIKPTVAEMLETPTARTFCLTHYDPDFPIFGYDDILDCSQPVPELEALERMAMVLHNQYPWNPEATRLEEIGRIDPDEFVVVFAPRNRDVLEFIRRVKAGRPARRRVSSPAEPRTAPAPVPPVMVRSRFGLMPKIEALAVTKGEVVCENSDVIRNAAYSWSPMTADEIREKTGIEARRYTSRDLEVIAYGAAHAALEGAGREPEEIAAVVFCSCTSTRALPSVATWLSGQLGIFQTHCSFDLVAACAGFPYGMAEAVRIMQDVRRPVLLVLGEKFSDKIGNVRPSRMIFGDGASALVIAPTEDPDESDVEVIQTYASGPASQVNSIIWPNPSFDNDVTVWGPEVKALVNRYLVQMMGELRELPDPDGGSGRLVDAIDLVVPHQANRTMVEEIASDAGLDREQMYFNIDKVGNVSAASIPIAIHDAVADGVIDRPMRIFTPGFGAGAVAGYVVMRVDPAVVVSEDVPPGEEMGLDFEPAVSSTIADVEIAFGT